MRKEINLDIEEEDQNMEMTLGAINVSLNIGQTEEEKERPKGYFLDDAFKEAFAKCKDFMSRLTAPIRASKLKNDPRSQDRFAVQIDNRALATFIMAGIITRDNFLLYKRLEPLDDNIWKTHQMLQHMKDTGSVEEYYSVWEGKGFMFPPAICFEGSALCREDDSETVLSSEWLKGMTGKAERLADILKAANKSMNKDEVKERFAAACHPAISSREKQGFPKWDEDRKRAHEARNKILSERGKSKGKIIF